jgi:hypothetical protein
MADTPPGWYHDPWQRAAMRWWDGARWTEHVAGWGQPAHTAPVPASSMARAAADAMPAEHTLSRWLRPLLVVWPLALAASSVSLASSVQQVIDNKSTSSTATGWDYIGNVGSVLSIALLVVRILWLVRAGDVGRRLGLPARRQPVASALGWIIPILNFWWPYQGVRDLFPVPERPGRRLGWWWGCNVAAPIALITGAAAAAFVPLGVAVALVAVALIPSIVAAALERTIVSDVLAIHERLTGWEPS